MEHASPTIIEEWERHANGVGHPVVGPVSRWSRHVFILGCGSRVEKLKEIETKEESACHQKEGLETATSVQGCHVVLSSEALAEDASQSFTERQAQTNV